jgi:hypothetical protein
MEHYELRLLADFLQPSLPAAFPQLPNTWARPTPALVGGELEQDERGEVVWVEIIPPVGVAGFFLVDEDLRKVVIVCDGHETSAYVSLSGVRTSLMAPSKDRIFGNRLYSLGSPHNTNPLLNTTLKYKQNVTVACLAGPNPLGITGATQPYEVRLWGYVYKASELPSAFNGGIMQFPAYLVDSARTRTVLINKAPIPVTAESWLTLPGGVDQAVPKINPFARYAYNALNTDGLQGDYQFRFINGGVIDEQENLYFEFDEKDALLIEGLGVTANFDVLVPPFPGAVPPPLARTGLRIAGDYHPKGPTTRLSLYPTSLIFAGINQLNYGRWPVTLLAAFPIPPLDVYVAIPKLDRPYLIWNEIGYVTIRDTGVLAAPVLADPAGVTVAVTGIRVEMRS